jgi:hypothetical protein
MEYAVWVWRSPQKIDFSKTTSSLLMAVEVITALISPSTVLAQRPRNLSMAFPLTRASMPQQHRGRGLAFLGAFAQFPQNLLMALTIEIVEVINE